MSEKRKDPKGRNLRNNESIMPDGRYRFRYIDSTGKRRAVYSWKLVDSDKIPVGKRECLSLRCKENIIKKDIIDGIDSTLSGNVALNDIFEKYIHLKSNLKESTYTTYMYCYNHWVRHSIGASAINSFHYSDIRLFYKKLADSGIKSNTLVKIHSILHPIFNLAVMDNLIRHNPADGACSE